MALFGEAFATADERPVQRRVGAAPIRLRLWGGAYTRLTFQNNGPVASSFPVRLLRYAVGIWN